MLSLAGLVLAVGDCIGFLPDDSGIPGVAAVALGCALHVGSAVCRLGKRELEAYQLGREVAQLDSRR